MRRLGIVDLLGLGATLLFALPIGVFGAQLLWDGHPLLGIAGVLIAGGLVLVERRLWTPSDVVGDLATRVVGLTVSEPGEERDDA